jgi:hypothetical protein
MQKQLDAFDRNAKPQTWIQSFPGQSSMQKKLDAFDRNIREFWHHLMAPFEPQNGEKSLISRHWKLRHLPEQSNRHAVLSRRPCSSFQDY